MIKVLNSHSQKTCNAQDQPEKVEKAMIFMLDFEM